MKEKKVYVNKIKIVSVLLLTLFVIFGNVFAVGGKAYGKNQGGFSYEFYDDTQVNHKSEIDSFPIEELSQEEIDGLILMREEEKLAKDVYLKLYDLWNVQIFSNIAKSEDTHTQAVKSLLDKYNLEDPVIDNSQGIFQNEDLQNLYDELVSQGSNSLLDALIVGATIEDLDIKDLQNLLETTDNQDIIAVYNNLQKGSRNHLRSFTKMINSNGGEYSAQYISEDYYNSIISSEIEKGGTYASSGNSQSNKKVQIIGNENTNQNPNKNNDLNSGNGQNNQNNPNSVYQELEEKEVSQNVFARMWRGFKNWFN